MRIALALLLAALVLAPLALAQQPAPNPNCPGFGGRNGGGGDGNFTRNGTRGNQTPIPGLSLRLDPEGPITLSPGATAKATLALANEGNATLDLALAANSFGRRSAASALAVSLDPDHGTLEPGENATVDVTLSLDASAAPGCPQMAFVVARDAGTNGTAGLRIVVDVPAPRDASPAADATTAKKTPLEVVAPLAGLALAALVPRRGGARP